MSVLQRAMGGGLPCKTLQFDGFVHPTFAGSPNNRSAALR